MNLISATYKYSWDFEYEWVHSIEIQLILWFIPTQFNIFFAGKKSESAHKCSWNFEYEWVNSIEIQLILWFIPTQFNINLYS